MLTAKYLGLSDTDGSSIAYSVHINRLGRSHKNQNASQPGSRAHRCSPAAELEWLARAPLVIPLPSEHDFRTRYRCVQKLASGAAFWAVEQGLEERALRESSLSLKRTVYLSTALGDEATR